VLTEETAALGPWVGVAYRCDKRVAPLLADCRRDPITAVKKREALALPLTLLPSKKIGLAFRSGCRLQQASCWSYWVRTLTAVHSRSVGRRTLAIAHVTG
jgi:hypothetical protein